MIQRRTYAVTVLVDVEVDGESSFSDAIAALKLSPPRVDCESYREEGCFTLQSRTTGVRVRKLPDEVAP